MPAEAYYFTLIQAAFTNQTVQRSWQVGRPAYLRSIRISASLNLVSVTATQEIGQIVVGTRSDLATAVSNLTSLDGLLARVVLNGWAATAAGFGGPAFENVYFPVNVRITPQTVIRFALTAGALGLLEAYITLELT